MTHNTTRLILVVEDDFTIGQLICEVLADEGYHVLWAHSAEYAQLCLESVEPSLITLDLNLPGMHGVTFVRGLRADSQRQHIPVILVSANLHQAEEVRDLVQAGVPKPFTLDRLVAEVQTLLTNDSATRLQERAANAPDKPDSPQTWLTS